MGAASFMRCTAAIMTLFKRVARTCGRRWVVVAFAFLSGCRAQAPSADAIQALVNADAGAEFELLYDIDPARVAAHPSARRFAEQLDAARAQAAGLSAVAKVMLQNDVWGFVQRLERSAIETEGRAALLTAAQGLVRALAPSDSELRSLEAPFPTLSFLEGFTEYDSEHPSLQHERAFGLRRLFRIYLRGRTHRALVSQLVALDAAGRPHLTNVVGEVEMLVFTPDATLNVTGTSTPSMTLRGARVFKRDRTLLTRKDGPPLVETRTVAHVPDRGANAFLAEFALPARDLDRLPCLECHDTSMMMSLPTAKTDPRQRQRQLLMQLFDTGL